MNIRGLFLILECLGILLLTSCIKDEHRTGEVRKNEAILSIPVLQDPSANPFEDDIINARLIVFRSAGQTNAGKLLVNKYLSGDNIIFKEIVPVGKLDIYLFANEFSEWGLDGATSVDDLADMGVVLSAGLPDINTHIPMFRRYKNVDIDQDGTMTYAGHGLGGNSFEVERLYAKVELALDFDYGEPVSIDSVSIKNVSDKTWFFQENSNPGTFYGTSVPDAEYFASGKVSHSYIFYIPEYMIRDKAKYIYMDIGIDGNSYTLAIGDGMKDRDINYMKGPDATLQDLTITRNTHYIFNITGVGMKFEVILSAEPWVAHSLPSNIGDRMLNLSTAQVQLYDGAVTRVYFASNQSEISTDNTSSPYINASIEFDPVEGIGYVDIFNTENPVSLPTTRTNEIYLVAGNLKRKLTVNTAFTARPPWGATGTSGAEADKRRYVGTFHRWNQTGERIICGANAGVWSAEVAESDGDFVILDRTASPSMTSGILYTANPGNAENYQVLDGAQKIYGEGWIFFRVGLKSRLASDGIVRYARIVLTTTGGSYDIFVRQGEAADYVMRNSEPGTSWVSRPAAVKFSPFNLTDPQKELKTTHIDRGTGGYTFTDYPSQAGYYFQWYQTWAWDPASSVNANEWSTNYSTGLWEPNKTVWETCPPGYRRPNNGSTTAHVNPLSAPVAGSEIRQSLYQFPPSGSGTDVRNSIRGFYADGFFDRRPIVASASNYAYTAVDRGSASVAYIGRLYYNPATNASVFIPDAGSRTSGTGYLSFTGRTSYVWSSTSAGDTYAIITLSTVEYSYHPVDILRNNGGTIRCVRE